MKSRILVVDDNPKNIQLLATMLTQSEYSVEYALSGPEAIEWMKQEQFDAVMLDIMMPGMDGYEVCELIKQIPGVESIPILFLTARDDIVSIQKAFKVGGVDYITKPFSKEEMLSRLETHIDLFKSKEKLNNVNEYLSKEVKSKTNELHQAYIKLQDANHELEELDSAKNEFLQLISHELRTPLNGIVGSSSLIKQMNPSDELLNVMQILDQSVSRLERYSYYALNISRLKVLKYEDLTIEDVDVCKFISGSIAEYKAKQKENQFDWQMDRREHNGKIKINKDLMQDAVLALMDVSAVFAKTKRALIGMNIHDGYFICQITDDGTPHERIEITETSLAFTAFDYHPTRSNSIELYFAKSVIQVLKGKIEFGWDDQKQHTLTVIKLPLSSTRLENEKIRSYC